MQLQLRLSKQTSLNGSVCSSEMKLYFYCSQHHQHCMALNVIVAGGERGGEGGVGRKGPP